MSSDVMMTYVASRQRYMITAPYHEDLVEVIKSIDHRSREYDADTKRWFVEPWARDHLIREMEHAGFRVQLESEPLPDSSGIEQFTGLVSVPGKCTSFITATEAAQWICSAPPADADTALWMAFFRTGCLMGVRILLLDPVERMPVDMRSPVQKRKDDGLAQDAARAAGHPDWDYVKSQSGVHLATNDDRLVSRYLSRYRKVYATDIGDDNCPVYFGIAV